MYPGLKIELKRVFANPYFRLTYSTQPRQNGTFEKYTLCNDLESQIASISKEKKQFFQEVSDDENCRINTVHTHDEYYYTVNVDGQTFRDDGSDETDYQELWNLCSARNTFDKDIRNHNVMRFLSKHK